MYRRWSFAENTPREPGREESADGLSEKVLQGKLQFQEFNPQDVEITQRRPTASLI